MIKNQKSKMSFKSNDGQLECYIDIKTQGDVSEYFSSEYKNVFNQNSIEEISERIEQEIQKQTYQTVEKSKELGIDFLGIGLEMYRKHPKEWQAYKDTWQTSSYKTIPVHVNSTVNIQNTGVLQ